MSQHVLVIMVIGTDIVLQLKQVAMSIGSTNCFSMLSQFGEYVSDEKCETL
jgi:glycine cleavage system regulatory protein